MTPQKSSRGRPKGTGLNDAAQLRAIAGLMATNPDLKPTTAIKTLGITDPSVIRRLRDKFAVVETQLIADIAPQLPFDPVSVADAPHEPRAKVASTATVGEARTAARAVPLAGARGECKSAPVPIFEALPTSAATIEQNPRVRRPALIPSPSETQLPHWLGVGLSLYVFSLETQYAVLGTLFQWPPMTAALKSQVAFAEIAIAMTKPVASSIPLA